MEVLQVKKYHNKIAQSKIEQALLNWKQNDNGYGYPIFSMYFFMLMDTTGCPTKRKNGYVAFEGNIAVFGISKERAINKFNKRSK